MPLYGHELGTDPAGKEIPIFAIGLAGFAVSLSPLKGHFIGRTALTRQQEAKRKILHRDYSEINNLPRRIRPFALLGKGLAREGSPVFKGGKAVGWVTSGTAVPFWKTSGEGFETSFTEETGRRSLGLAYIDSDILKGDEIEIEVRNKPIAAVVVPAHLRSEAPPYCYPEFPQGAADPSRDERGGAETSREYEQKAVSLISSALENNRWRREECLNLIPSEMTASVYSRGAFYSGSRLPATPSIKR